MRLRWLGITGIVLLLSSLVLGTLGPQLWPTAFWRSSYPGMMGPGMMDGMMSGTVGGDPNQPFDRRFLDQMIMHHLGAVMSAQMMIADSDQPELRDLAQRIITTQQQEIEQMRQWRMEWYGTTRVSDPQEAMMEQMITGRGTMNRDQMRQMMVANTDFDRMFLQMLIPHHAAAISMAEQALEQAEHPELKTLAENIIADQQAEIDEMRGYLRDWYGEEAADQ